MTTDIRKAAEPPLRPCPFCGGEPYSCRHLSYSNWGVACQCGATGPTKNAGYRPLREAEIRAHNEAVEAWNQRAGLAAEQPQPKVQPAVGVQACRPEDRAMLSTPAGAELLTKVAMALTVPQAVATAPKRIWLQVSDDRADMDEPFPGDGATWCADSVVDAEVEYVRADLAPPPSASEPITGGTKLWLWRNGDHYLAFRHLYPCYSPGGDPMTLGEPAAWAEFRESHNRAGKGGD
ncbi:MAG: Lar family restriction alleviation protein [Burkholderiales bacterium]|nr:Lar family restriction alleviation protein [Burkholderiales bacterium]